MPELPEVETIRRHLLDQNIIGQTVTHIQLPPSRVTKATPALRKKFSQLIIQDQILQLERRGKYLFMVLEKTGCIFHFGMSGIFRWEEKRLSNQASQKQRENPKSKLQKHSHLIMDLEEKTLARKSHINKQFRLTYSDPRTFGRIIPYLFNKSHQHLSPSLESNQIRLNTLLDFFSQLTQLGPDVILAKDQEIIESCFKYQSRRAIKTFLLDQKILAGVGNIYADESLFEAGIHPQRMAGSLTRKEWEMLVTVLKKIMDKAIHCQGSTLADYHRPDGIEGSFQQEFQVYGRGGEPCYRCDRILQRIILNARSTVFCPHCQRKKGKHF